MLRTKDFQEGLCDVNYIDRHPQLLDEPEAISDRGTKLLHYIGDITVNGYAGAGAKEKPDFAPVAPLSAEGKQYPAVQGRCWKNGDLKKFPNGSWIRKN